MAPDPAPAPAPGRALAVNVRDLLPAWRLIRPTPPPVRPQLVTTREEETHA